MLYSGDTAGHSYDDVNKFYGDDTIDINVDNLVSNGYVSIDINETTYFINIYTGPNTTDCCSNLEGVEYDESGSFISVGFALIKVNGVDLLYVPLYDRII